MTAQHPIDGFDLRILLALQRDGRLTNAELAEVVALSPSQCSRRRQALERAGLISTYVALLSPAALGLDVTAFVEVTLQAHSPERSKAFGQVINRTPEVQEGYALTGDIDYLLKLVVPDLQTLSEVLNHRLLAHESIARIQSFIVLEHLKQTTALPLDRVETG